MNPSAYRSMLLQAKRLLHTRSSEHVTKFAQLPNRAVLSVSGSQSSEFLNGLLARAIPTIQRPSYSALLNAQGRVLYDLFVYTQTSQTVSTSTSSSVPSTSYLIEYDSRAEPLLPYLKRHILRSKVRVRDVSEEFDVWHSWNTQSTAETEQERSWAFAPSGAIEPVWEAYHNTELEWPWEMAELMVRDRRAPALGTRLLTRKGDPPPQASSGEQVSSEDYLYHRIMHGVPEGIDDIVPGSAFPMESNLDVMGGLDFRKGCYVGQELTVRTYHTGAVRKRILPVQLVLSTSHPPLPGSQISDPASRRGGGRLLSFLPSRGVGLALLRTQGLRKPKEETVQSEQEHLLRIQDGDQEVQLKYWWPEWFPQPPAVD